MTVRLPCTKAWFEGAIRGEPDFRPKNDYWTKRLKNKKIDSITFTLGYPKKSEESRHFTTKRFKITENKTHFIISQ